MTSGAEIEAAEKRILLVEDDADLRFLLTHVLRSEGYIVDPATTHAEASAQLEERRYALVIADWRLPDGEGTTIADGASELGAKTIVMTGYLFQMPAGSAGAHETLMKPVRPSEIIDTVQRLIGQPNPR
jgi:DNA-binding response OmpR family regulator